jgi:hypothetical protein
MSAFNWPESLRPLYEEAQGASLEAAVGARAQWKNQLTHWASAATLDERIRAQEAALVRLDTGELSPGEQLFLLS